MYTLELPPVDERLGFFVVCDDGVGRSWSYWGVLVVERLGILYTLELLPVDERLGFFIVCDDGVGRSWLYRGVLSTRGTPLGICVVVRTVVVCVGPLLYVGIWCTPETEFDWVVDCEVGLEEERGKVPFLFFTVFLFLVLMVMGAFVSPACAGSHKSRVKSDIMLCSLLGFKAQTS